MDTCYAGRLCSANGHSGNGTLFLSSQLLDSIVRKDSDS